jgi:hypothetical protein
MNLREEALGFGFLAGKPEETVLSLVKNQEIGVISEKYVIVHQMRLAIG